MRSHFLAWLVLLIPTTSLAQSSAPSGTVNADPPVAIVAGPQINPPAIETQNTQLQRSQGTTAQTNLEPSGTTLPASADYSELITFDEFPAGTPVPDSYRNQGIAGSYTHLTPPTIHPV